MVRTETSVNITQAGAAEPLPLILIACIVIAIIGMLIGFLWLRQRRARDRQAHLNADIARPETLSDIHEDTGRPLP